MVNWDRPEENRPVVPTQAGVQFETTLFFPSASLATLQLQSICYIQTLLAGLSTVAM